MFLFLLALKQNNLEGVASQITPLINYIAFFVSSLRYLSVDSELIHCTHPDLIGRQNLILQLLLPSLYRI